MLLQCAVLLLQRGHLRVEVPPLRRLAVDAECDDAAEGRGDSEPETACCAAVGGCTALDDGFLAET